MLVIYYKFSDIIFCEILDISKAISDYGAQSFSPHSPRASLPIYLITCSSPHRTSKDGDILHPLGQLLLTLEVDFTSHGLMFKGAIHQSLGFFLTWFEFSRMFSLSSIDFNSYTWVQFSLCSCLYFWFSWVHYYSYKEEYLSRHKNLFGFIVSHVLYLISPL